MDVNLFIESSLKNLFRSVEYYNVWYYEGQCLKYNVKGYNGYVVMFMQSEVFFVIFQYLGDEFFFGFVDKN